MEIRKASIKDISEIISIYHIAVDHMFLENNTKQWKKDDSRFKEEIYKYIDKNELYVVIDSNEIVGFFAMIYGIDKTYNVIKDGKWINQEPYVTIHKIASKYYQRHIATYIINYVYKTIKKDNIYNVRIDTHADNISMQTFLRKHGFIKCGIISITCNFDDQESLRNAYIKTLK